MLRNGHLTVAWLNQWDPQNPRAGGAERTILELGGRLASLGVDLRVFSERRVGLPPETLLKGFRILRPAGPIGLHLWAISASAQARLREGAGVVIYDLAKIMPWTLRRSRSGERTIGFVHHMFGRQLLREVFPVAGALAALAERVGPTAQGINYGLTETNYTRDAMVKCGWPREKVYVIPPGLDRSKFQPDPLARSPTPTLLCVGRLRKYKRVDLAIKAVAMVRQSFPGIRLVIIGEGPDERRLRDIVEKLGAGPFVRFLGRVTDEELKANYQRSWANLQASTVEGWGLTVLEAAACGTPTIAFRNSVFPETVGTFLEPYLAVDGDVKDYARQIERCLRTVEGNADSTRDQLTEYAKCFDWNVTAKLWFEMLEEVAAG